MPTKTMEVLQLQDQGNKMLLDSVLTTHERVVQVGTLEETWNVSTSPGSFLVEFQTWYPVSTGFLHQDVQQVPYTQCLQD